MGLGSFFKSLVSQEAAGDQMIASLEMMYQMRVKALPNVNPHEHLTEVYLTRSAGFGKAKRDEAHLKEASMITMLYACLPPPKNIRALALSLLFRERLDIIKACPKFMAEYDDYMRPIEAAKANGQLNYLYKKYNP